MLTNLDIKKLRNIFATKEELSEGINGLRGEFPSGFDEIMFELKAIREEL